MKTDNNIVFIDQASTLRRIASGNKMEKKNKMKNTRVISVTSGKGGVGKTNIVCNLAYLLSRFDKKVMILDADTGLANIDILLGLTPEYNLEHVFNGEKQLKDVIIDGPGGIKIIPASSGIQSLSELSQDQKLQLLTEFDSLDEELDFFIIDTAAGISSNVVYFNLAAQEKIVVVTPEPTSITDAYAIMKVMSKNHGIKSFKLIVNLVENEEEARNLYNFLKASIDFCGYIVKDNRVSASVIKQKLVTVMYPDSAACICFAKLARTILQTNTDSLPDGNIGFFWSHLMESSL